MKYGILHDFRTSTQWKEKSSDDFKYLDKLKLLANFNVNVKSLLKRITNYEINV